MSTDNTDKEQMVINSKKKSKGKAHSKDEVIDENFDAMLDSAAKTLNQAATSNARLAPQFSEGDRDNWSMDTNNNVSTIDMIANPTALMTHNRQNFRRATEEIIATDIPTISMDDMEGDETLDLAPQVAVAPEFSVHQIASFKEIEKEFSRERASQYIDSKIDIGILYQNLHLQEDYNAEDQKPWDWDKLFVEIRNSITNPTIES